MALAERAREEVRRCAKCGQAALVTTAAWQHSFSGMATGTVTRDCVCQSCGAAVTLHPKSRTLGLWIAAALLLPTVIPSLIVGFIALRRTRAWSLNPVVPDAPMPELRFKSGPGDRRCGCGGTARLVKVTRHTHNGIPTGTEHEYQCGKCNKEFVVESVGGIIMSLIGAAVLAVIGGLFLAEAEKPLTRFGWGGAFSFFALLLLAQAGNRIANYFRYPTL